MAASPRKTAPSAACPCGSPAYGACCGRFIDGGEVPASALELMRSRYTAYVLQHERYLRQTWYLSTRPASGFLSENDAIKWLSLDILRHHEAGSDGTVEFIARYKVRGRAHKLHETSRFVREDGRWFYLDGSFPQPVKA